MFKQLHRVVFLANLNAIIIRSSLILNTKNAVKVINEAAAKVVKENYCLTIINNLQVDKRFPSNSGVPLKTAGNCIVYGKTVYKICCL